MYRHTDLYQVLSSSYVPLFSKFTGINHPDHLMVQTNPVTLDSSDFVYSFPKSKRRLSIWEESTITKSVYIVL